MLLVVADLFDNVFFHGSHFVVAVVVAVVVYFECVDFVVFAAGIDIAAVHTLFVDCVQQFLRLLLLLLI